MIEKLIKYLDKNPSMIMFGRVLQARDPEMYNFVMSWYIGDSFNEKLYCRMNNINSLPVCPGTGKLLKFISYHEGYPSTAKGFKLENLTPLDETFYDEEIEFMTSDMIINNPINLKIRCEIYQKLIYHTANLKNPTITERIFCYMNDIFETPENSRFVNYYEGYIIKGFDYDLYFLELAKKIGSIDINDGRTINEFLIRSKKNNKHLYEFDEDQESIEFVTCPILGARMYMVRTDYITNVLKMTVENFDDRFPNFKKVSDIHIQNIKNGVQIIDEALGITKHRISVVKTQETLKAIDDTGLTGYQKLGIKTRQTHMENIDEFGRNGYSQLATKAILVGNTTKMKRGIITDADNTDKFKRYKAVILYVTQKLKKELTNGYITGLAGTKGAYHIDHNYSIYQGYKNRVSPLVIGHRCNLRMIPWKENVVKHSRSDILIEELYKSIGITQVESNEEFKDIMKIIEIDIDNSYVINGGYVLERYYETKICCAG